MDSKSNPEPAVIKAAVLKAKAIIKDFKPDVLISCDDNAAKYLIEPFYKNNDLPIVFYGINWDASIYGFPFNNMTGTVEVALITEILRHLQKYAKGNRIGFLGGDRLSERKNRHYYQKRFSIDFAKTYFASSFEEWQRHFVKLQDEVDMLITTLMLALQTGMMQLQNLSLRNMSRYRSPPNTNGKCLMHCRYHEGL